MLMVIVLTVFGKAHRRVTLLVERQVVSTSQITVQTEHEQRLDSEVIRSPNFGDVARELARAGVALSA